MHAGAAVSVPPAISHCDGVVMGGPPRQAGLAWPLDGPARSAQGLGLADRPPAHPPGPVVADRQGLELESPKLPETGALTPTEPTEGRASARAAGGSSSYEASTRAPCVKFTILCCRKEPQHSVRSPVRGLFAVFPLASFKFQLHALQQFDYDCLLRL